MIWKILELLRRAHWHESNATRMDQNGIKMIKRWRLETNGKFVNTFVFFRIFTNARTKVTCCCSCAGQGGAHPRPGLGRTGPAAAHGTPRANAWGRDGPLGLQHGWPSDHTSGVVYLFCSKEQEARGRGSRPGRLRWEGARVRSRGGSARPLSSRAAALAGDRLKQRNHGEVRRKR
jgi:hypothetical protein